MSKRGEQVRRHLERLEAEWEAAHPGESIGPVVSARLATKAWAHERPAKKPTTLREEAHHPPRRTRLGDRATRGRLRPRHVAPGRAPRAGIAGRPFRADGGEPGAGSVRRGRVGVDAAHGAGARNPDHDRV